MIILTVCLFGTRRGVLAGAIGAGLSDFLGGYAVWVLPTMLLKGLWAFIAGTIAYKLLPNFKYSWLVGAIVGVLAGAIGAGLSDFLGGYAVWVLPTMLLKGLWAFIAGTIAYKLLPNFKYSWLVGAIVGGIAHIIGYTLVKIPLYDTVVAFGEMFTLSMQTIAGIVLGGVVYTILVQSPAIRTLKAKFA